MTRNKKIFTRKILFYLILIILGIGLFLNFDKIAQGAVNITGDVYSGGSLGNNITVKNNSVVSANGTVDVAGSVYKINGYNQSLAKLVNADRAKGVINKLKTLSPVTISGDYINIGTNNNPNNFPEGTIYYKPNGDLHIPGGSYSGKSTLIVENGDLYIDGGIYYANKNASVGFIVRNTDPAHGNIYISNNVQTLNGVYYATGAIIFNK